MPDVVVTSDIAGAVYSVEVKTYDQVTTDQALLVIESMKMHIPVEAPRDGTVSEVLVKTGDAVEEGQALVRLTV
jgi:acetyl-CoA carboxylase biotin carboxyl carrier protein